MKLNKHRRRMDIASYVELQLHSLIRMVILFWSVII